MNHFVFKGGAIPRAILSFLLAFCLAAATAHADTQAGLAALKRGDYATAFRELLRPAEQGDAKAQFFVGALYEEGKGVPKDEAAAVQWYRKAAEQGDAVAQTLIGASYVSGVGIECNFVLAYAWLNLAAAAGEGEAVGLRDQIGSLLTPRQLAEAQALAASWQVGTPFPTKTKTWKAEGRSAPTHAARRAVQPVSSTDCRPRGESLSCQSQCMNGSCVVTYENGCRVRVQVRPSFDPFTNQWTYPAPSC